MLAISPNLYKSIGADCGSDGAKSLPMWKNEDWAWWGPFHGKCKSYLLQIGSPLWKPGSLISNHLWQPILSVKYPLVVDAFDQNGIRFFNEDIELEIPPLFLILKTRGFHGYVIRERATIQKTPRQGNGPPKLRLSVRPPPPTVEQKNCVRHLNVETLMVITGCCRVMATFTVQLCILIFEGLVL